MQIENELEEILEQAFNAGENHRISFGESPNFKEWIEENRSNILALGKPEPLAKNKQMQLSCDECGSENITSYNDGFREKCNDCGARIGTRKADATSR